MLKKLTSIILGMSLLYPYSSVAAETLNVPDSISQYIQSQNADISFYYEDLTTGNTMVYQETEIYSAASTIKLPLALYVYQLASEGKIDLNERLTYKKYHYYGGTGIIQYNKVGTTYTIRELVKYAMEYSDNIAFIMLKERVGAGNFINFMQGLGGKVTYPNGQNLTTAEDMNVYLEALDRFTKEQPDLGGELIYYLEHTIFNERIPAGIPNVDIAHKIGTLPLELTFHDVGIVYDDHPFLLSILSDGISESREGVVLSHLASLIYQEHLEGYDENVSILVNQQRISFPDAKPYIDHHVNRTVVPVRFVSEELGAKVEWIPDSNSVKIIKGGTEIILTVGKNTALVNNQVQTLDFTPVIWRNRVLVPVRFVAEALGESVGWDASTNSVSIFTQ